MEILALKLFREEIFRKLSTNYRKNLEIYILSLREMKVCFKLPANYYRCEELTISGKYLQFLNHTFKVIRRYVPRKKWFSLEPEDWELFIKLLKGRLKELRNQVLWSLTVNPHWVYETLKALPLLGVKKGYILLAVASHPFRSPVGILSLKSRRVKVFTLPLKDMASYFLTYHGWETLKPAALCGRILLEFHRGGDKIPIYSLKVEFDDNPRWELWSSWIEEELYPSEIRWKELQRLEKTFFLRVEKLLSEYRKTVFNSLP